MVEQAYTGSLLADGRIKFDTPSIKLPTPCRVVIKPLGNPTRPDAPQRVARFRKIMQEASAAENELTDADWDELENIRKDTNAGMSRTVDL